MRAAITHTAADEWWRTPPCDRVSYLAEVDPDALAIALDPLPDDAPAVVRFRPPAASAPSLVVGVLLDELDRLARSLLPEWLPGAGRLDGSGTLGVAAARRMAQRAAAESDAFGPFLADLAGRAAGGGSGTRFPAEVRAAGLVGAVARAYRRDRVAVLVDVPLGLGAPEEAALAGAAEWLAGHGRCAVWLAGPPLVTVDRIPVVRLALPPALVRSGEAPAQPGDPAAAEAPVLTACSPVAGVPRWDSEAEQALERALARCDWAAGRRWNITVGIAGLSRPYRVDLLWLAERVVVEVDGDDHRARAKWCDDRARDVALASEGYYVLRFPNEDVLGDAPLVAERIRKVLSRRRGARTPGEEI